MVHRTLLLIAAALMFLDAVAYSLGALGPIQRALRPADPYWKRRLTLNLLLANQGLYFAAVAAFIGAVYIDTQPQAANVIEILSLLTCAYTVITVPVVTPKDWPHVLPRGTRRGPDAGGLGDAVTRP
jgi:hypothetical protein